MARVNKQQSRKNDRRKSSRAERSPARPAVVKALAENTQRMKEEMRLRAEEGDELAALQARSVEVEEQGIHLAQRSGLNKEQFDELHAFAPKYAAKYDEELRRRAADLRKPLHASQAPAGCRSATGTDRSSGQVFRREILGGLIHEYEVERAA
jgi:hypothetical protein